MSEIIPPFRAVMLSIIEAIQVAEKQGEIPICRNDASKLAAYLLGQKTVNLTQEQVDYLKNNLGFKEYDPEQLKKDHADWHAKEAAAIEADENGEDLEGGDDE